MALNFRKEKLDVDTEKEIVAGMIASDGFLSRIESIFDRTLLGSKPAKIIVGWVLEYWTSFGKAPGRSIQKIYIEKSQDLEEDSCEQLETYLTSLSHLVEDGFDVDLALQRARVWLKERKIYQLSESLRTLSNEGDIDGADELIQEYRDELSLEMADSSTVSVSAQTLRHSLDDEYEKPLIHLPGALGDMLNSDFTRSSFVAFQAPEKAGKSGLLIELAFRAWVQGRSVYFVALGDMSIQQVQKRILQRCAKQRVLRSDDTERPHFVPVLECKKNLSDECELSCRIKKNSKVYFEDPKGEVPATHRPCTECLKERSMKFHFQGTCVYRKVKGVKQLTGDDATSWDSFQKLAGKAQLFVDAYPSDQVNVHDITQKVEELEAANEIDIPVVIIDYADNLGREPSVRSGESSRDTEHIKWKALRGLSLLKNRLVITASQADANARYIISQTLNNFSEDKRKAGQVTALYAINRTVSEKKEHKCRIGTLCRREGECNEDRQVTLLQYLGFGKPLLGSYVTYVSQEFGMAKEKKE